LRLLKILKLSFGGSMFNCLTEQTYQLATFGNLLGEYGLATSRFVQAKESWNSF